MSILTELRWTCPKDKPERLILAFRGGPFNPRDMNGNGAFLICRLIQEIETKYSRSAH
jgi:hypothetical protein